MLTLITKADAAPVSVIEVRAHCRIDDDEHDEDALLAGYIRAAADWVENQESIALMTQVWEYSLDAFPCSYRPVIRLPIVPLQSVDQITYVDAQGNTQIMPTVDYQLVGGRLWPAAGTTWPATRYPADVVIRFTAGFGNDWNAVPEPIRQAILMLVAYWHGQREAVVLGGEGDISSAPFGRAPAPSALSPMGAVIRLITVPEVAGTAPANDPRGHRASTGHVVRVCFGLPARAQWGRWSGGWS